MTIIRSRNPGHTFIKITWIESGLLHHFFILILFVLLLIIFVFFLKLILFFDFQLLVLDC